MTFFHASGQQRDGEGAEQGNEGGDPGDNRRQLGIPDVIVEEVHQRSGLKEECPPHQKDIAGEDPPRTIGAQANPGAFQGHALPGEGNLFFDVAKAHQQEKGRQYAKNHRGIEEPLLLVAFAQHADQRQGGHGDDGGPEGSQQNTYRRQRGALCGITG